MNESPFSSDIRNAVAICGGKQEFEKTIIRMIEMSDEFENALLPDERNALPAWGKEGEMTVVFVEVAALPFILSLEFEKVFGSQLVHQVNADFIAWANITGETLENSETWRVICAKVAGAAAD